MYKIQLYKIIGAGFCLGHLDKAADLSKNHDLNDFTAIIIDDD